MSVLVRGEVLERNKREAVTSIRTVLRGTRQA